MVSRKVELSEETRKKLDSLYLDIGNSAAFGGILSLKRAVNKNKWKISHNQILAYLRSHPTYSIYQIRKKRFKRAPVVSWGIDYLWSIDLADFQSLSKWNAGIHFILVLYFSDLYNSMFFIF